MDVTTIIAILALIASLGGAIWYLIRQKRRGSACIGCPVGEGCPAKNGVGTAQRGKVVIPTISISPSVGGECSCGK